MASVAFDDRCGSPDEEATRLYEEHSDWLLGFCTRQLGARSDAEDAVQATFLYAFRALRRGVVPECGRAWLTTIARNVCHTQRRTRNRHPEDATDLDLDRIGLAQPDRGEVGFIDDVRAALSALPATQRRALVLREWHGASSSEIASELELSEQATHSVLFRARRSFATALAASGRPFAGLNLVGLAEQLRILLKPLLASSAGKAAGITLAAGVVAGGVAIEHRGDAAVPERTAPASGPAASGLTGARAPASPPATAQNRTRPVTASVAPRRSGSASSTSPSSDGPVVRANRPRGGATQVPPATPPPRAPAGEVQSSSPPLRAAPLELPLRLPAVKLLPTPDVPPVAPPPLPAEVLPPIEVPPVEVPPVQRPPLAEPEPPLP